MSISVGAVADAVVDEELSRPRWAISDLLFLTDDDVDAGAVAGVAAGGLMGEADAGAGAGADVGGLIGDVAVLDRDSDRERAGLGGRGVDDADAGVDGDRLDVAAASDVDADDAGLLLHDG